jgi:hypothetical protein
MANPHRVKPLRRHIVGYRYVAFTKETRKKYKFSKQNPHGIQTLKRQVLLDVGKKHVWRKQETNTTF